MAQAARVQREDSPRMSPNKWARVARRIAAVTLTLLMANSAWPAVADPEDGAINDLRSQSASVASQVAELDVRIGQLEAEVDDAWQSVAKAAEDYTQATVDLGNAKKAAKSAQDRYQVALEQREASRQILVQLVRETSRNGAGTTSLQVFFNAEGFDDAVAGAAAVNLVEGKAQRAVQQYEADSVVADTLKAAADKSVALLETAKQQAADSLQEAEAQQQRAEQMQATVATQREQLVAQLAQLRQSTVAAEGRRQQRLERERERAREEAARRAQQDRDNSSGQDNGSRSSRDRDNSSNRDRGESNNQSNRGGSNTGSGSNSGSTTGGNSSNSGGNSGGGNSSGGSSGNTGGNSGGGSNNSGGNSGGGSTGGGNGGSGGGGESGSGGSNSGGSSGGGNSGGGSTGGGNSGGSNGGSSGGGLGQGTSVSTAAQGRAAVAAAKKQLGIPYGWGATGPGAFDCSGMTQHAWRAAGVSLQRTSRSQYVQVKKIKMDNLRPGDLLFWGSNPNDPQSIWHVAMYVSPGQMIEAPRPGSVVKLSPIRYTNLMPYAGRP